MRSPWLGVAWLGIAALDAVNAGVAAANGDTALAVIFGVLCGMTFTLGCWILAD